MSDKNEKRIEQLEKEKSGFEKIISDSSKPESVRKAMTTARNNVQAEIDKLKKTGESDSAGKSEPSQKPAAKKSPGKKKKAAVSPKIKHKSEKREHHMHMEHDEEKPEFVTVHYNGKTETFNINNCEEALKAMIARKERDKETSAKTKSRLPVTAAVKSMENTITHIEDMIPDSNIDKHSDKVIKALGGFRKTYE